MSECRMTAHVYMVRCSDGTYYVGSTRTSLETRVAEHNAGRFGGYTAKRRPVTLVFSQSFEAIEDCIAAERQLKGWGRDKKEALIQNDIEGLRKLAKRRGGREPRAPRITPSSFETPALRAPQDEDENRMRAPRRGG